MNPDSSQVGVNHQAVQAYEDFFDGSGYVQKPAFRHLGNFTGENLDV